MGWIIIAIRHNSENIAEQHIKFLKIASKMN